MEWVARAAVIAIVAVAPFEGLRPLLKLPGQSLSTVEATLAGVLLMTGWAVLRDSRVPRIATREALPWLAFVVTALLAALLAPRFRSNAFHMAIRYAAMTVIFGLTLIASRSPRQLRPLLVGFLVAGGAVAGLVIADFAGFSAVRRLLSVFRDGIAVVGDQVRASGPFQYPTIASMYLEIAFAIGLGLLVTARRRRAAFVAIVFTLATIVEAVTLTFTRSGLVTILLSLMLVGFVHYRRHRVDRGTRGLVLLLGVLVVAVLSSRSVESLRLRMTSEIQGDWFSAAIEAPRTIELRTRELTEVPIVLTNIGRASWDSFSAQPVLVSYHWIAADSDEVVWWEGERTAFPERVSTGTRVPLRASVRAPQQAGRYRLMWDLEQRDRLWFSTEPEAVIYVTEALVSGTSTSMPPTTGPRHVPKAAVRPGRSILWLAAWRMFAAHPLFGIGPDNYRLSYGDYVAVPRADPRVHSNNMYLEVLAGTGLIGLACVAWIALLVAARSMRAIRVSGAGAGIVAACLAVGVHGLVDSFLGFTGTYIAIAVALGLAVSAGGQHTRHAHRV